MAPDNRKYNKETEVTAAEKKLLDEAFDHSYDTDTPVESLSLDNKDEDGEPLEEKGLENSLFGNDLDDDLEEEEDEESEGEKTGGQ
jgi:hypothetical protein